MVEINGDVYGHNDVTLEFYGICDCGADLFKNLEPDDIEYQSGDGVDEIICDKCGKIWAFEYELKVEVPIKRVKEVKAEGCIECDSLFEKDCSKCEDWKEE